MPAAVHGDVSKTSSVGAAQGGAKEDGAPEKMEVEAELVTCEPDIEVVWAGQEISHLQEKLDVQAVEQSILVTEVRKLGLSVDSLRIQLASAESDLDFKQKDVDMLKVFFFASKSSFGTQNCRFCPDYFCEGSSKPRTGLFVFGFYFPDNISLLSTQVDQYFIKLL